MVTVKLPNGTAWCKANWVFLLILCGALVHFLPARKGLVQARKPTISRRGSKVTKCE